MFIKILYNIHCKVDGTTETCHVCQIFEIKRYASHKSLNE